MKTISTIRKRDGPHIHTCATAITRIELFMPAYEYVFVPGPEGANVSIASDNTSRSTPLWIGLITRKQPSTTVGLCIPAPHTIEERHDGTLIIDYTRSEIEPSRIAVTLSHYLYLHVRGVPDHEFFSSFWNLRERFLRIHLITRGGLDMDWFTIIPAQTNLVSDKIVAFSAKAFKTGDAKASNMAWLQGELLQLGDGIEVEMGFHVIDISRPAIFKIPIAGVVGVNDDIITQVQDDPHHEMFTKVLRPARVLRASEVEANVV